MQLTRHVPEVGGVVTLHSDADGWRGELTQGGSTDLAPLPSPSAAGALQALGLDPGAPWATELAAAAQRAALSPARRLD